MVKSEKSDPPVVKLSDSGAFLPPSDAIRDATILIVDDDPINVKIIANLFSNIADSTIIKAFDGDQAIRLIEEGTVPDIILLDIMMPKISGYEVAQRIREKFHLFEVPIIMLTAKDQVQDIISAFRSGANDYVKKPFNRFELIARINMLLTLKNAISERQKLISIEEDIEIAKKIQESALSNSLPESDKFSITVRYVPMRGIGGDFYGFHTIGDNLTGVLIADVNGHGIHAALIASMIKIIFSTLRPHARNPVSFLTEMNNIIMKNTENTFITALYAILDTSDMSLRFSRAGHESVILYRKESNTIIQNNIHGRIIGFSEDVNFQLGTIQLRHGDRIILYTDGITETFNSKYEMFGQDRFIDLIKSSADLDSSSFADSVIENVTEWSGNVDNYLDDITLIVIDV